MDVPAQSALVSHSTQVDVATSQWRATAPVHCASEVQPARQRNMPGSQTGCAAPQSAFVRQATQAPRPMKQRGAPATVAQSAFDAHCTQRSVAGSQILASPVQSVDVRHSTQAPLPVSQMGSLRVQPDVGVQAVWQLLVEGEHTGMADGHPAAPLQETQAPSGEQ